MFTIHYICMYPQMLVSNLSGISDRTAFTENTSLGNDEDKKTALNVKSTGHTYIPWYILNVFQGKFEEKSLYKG